jgi:hypothetical protein
VFEAFRTDLVPWSRFADFFREQYLAARLFQDLIWACTAIDDGPYVQFAAEHRRRDSGHFRWLEKDLKAFGLTVTAGDFFCLEWLPTRSQMGRILGHLADATPERRMVALASLESAGAVTLGTLFSYVARHGESARLLYLGEAHIAVERGQVDALSVVARDLLGGDEPALQQTVDLVFDALSTMFSSGGQRIYGDLLGARNAA